MSGLVSLHPLLLAELNSGQISHAYIFSGSAAEQQAVALTAALNCQQPEQDGAACGNCPVCLNIMSGAHADLLLMEPNGTSYKVEAIRALVAQAGLSHLSGSYRVFVLRDAEKLNIESANTLLKLLEEPIPDTVIILLATQPEQLLPTILSRCQLFFFDSGGSLEPGLTKEQLKLAEDFLCDLPDLPVYQVLVLARAYDKDREGQRLFLFALLKILHLAARGEKSLPMSGPNILRSAALVERSLELMGKTVNQKLLTDVVYLRLKQNSVD